eukprot:m51a1_g8684 putative serine-threonine protein (933) ;mRNA; r:2530-5940
MCVIGYHEGWDDWGQYMKYGTAPVTNNTCKALDPLNPSTDGSALELVQLFTPPEVPWKYTDICFIFRYEWSGTKIDLHNFTFVMYEDNEGQPGQLLASDFRTLSVPYKTQQNSMSVSGLSFVATRPRVFIGYSVTEACTQVTYPYSDIAGSRLSFYRMPGASWNRHRADWVTDNISSVTIRTQGTNFSGEPTGWTCPGKYKDGTCDCECGLWDPDCHSSKKGPVSASCSAGQVCSPKGKCLDPGWTATGVCALASFGSGDGCQCGCGGTLDPDCRGQWDEAGGPWYPRALNCPDTSKVYRCTDSNTCEAAWTCAAGAFGDRTKCDCSCQQGGVRDPDCSFYAKLPSDCGTRMCSGDKCLQIPYNWACTYSYYANGFCQCSCQGWDSDCNVQASPTTVGGCGSAGVCRNVNNVATCVSPGCSNGVVETKSEQCETGGAGCANCTCKLGWGPMVPPVTDCRNKCGDGIVVGDEECDGGVFCTACKCDSGHAERNPRASSCQGCGNDLLDAGEDCDGGPGCIPATCKCVAGFRQTSPPSLSCEQQFPDCGDSAIQSGEECDGGLYCNAINCTCGTGSKPYSTPKKYCLACGNGVPDDGEECDGGAGCTKNCKCAAKFTAATPASTDCVSIPHSCGNKKLDSSEECDSGKFCRYDCKCSEGHEAYAPVQLYCRGCGNGVVEDSEECDAGLGCSTSCRCAAGFRRTSPPTSDCEEYSNVSASKSKDNGIAVGVPIGVTGVVVIGAMCGVLYAVFHIRRKEEPSRPIDSHAGDIKFVPTGDASMSPVVELNVLPQPMSQMSMSMMSGFVPYVHSQAPDGTPIVVVPLNPGESDSSSSTSGTVGPATPQMLAPPLQIGAGYLQPGAPVDPLVLMSLSSQLPQISQSVQRMQLAGVLPTPAPAMSSTVVAASSSKSSSSGGGPDLYSGITFGPSSSQGAP